MSGDRNYVVKFLTTEGFLRRDIILGKVSQFRARRIALYCQIFEILQKILLDSEQLKEALLWETIEIS